MSIIYYSQHSRGSLIEWMNNIITGFYGKMINVPSLFFTEFSCTLPILIWVYTAFIECLSSTASKYARQPLQKDFVFICKFDSLIKSNYLLKKYVYIYMYHHREKYMSNFLREFRKNVWCLNRTWIHHSTRSKPVGIEEF